MGFFDFFRPKSKPLRKHPLPKGTLDAALSHERQRPGHYMLAHVALRQMALADPLQFLAILASPQARDFIADTFDRVKQLCQENGETPDFTADEVKIHCVRAGGFPCAVVEMPPPGAMAEAHFTALVVYANLANDLNSNSSSIPARYFTLERGMQLDGQARTVLCEWTETAHNNFGDGPEPTVSAFVNSLPQSKEQGQL